MGLDAVPNRLYVSDQFQMSGPDLDIREFAYRALLEALESTAQFRRRHVWLIDQFRCWRFVVAGPPSLCGPSLRT